MWDARRVHLDFTTIKMTPFCLRQCGHVWISNSETSFVSNMKSLYLLKLKISRPSSELYKPTRVNNLTPHKEINSNNKKYPFSASYGISHHWCFDKGAKLLFNFSKFPCQICNTIRKIEIRVDSGCQLYSVHKDQCF